MKEGREDQIPNLKNNLNFPKCIFYKHFTPTINYLLTLSLSSRVKFTGICFLSFHVNFVLNPSDQGWIIYNSQWEQYCGDKLN